MYRILFIVVTLLVGTLNSSNVTVDLLWVQLDWPLGLLLLTACATGLALGWLLVWLFSVLPLRARLRRMRAQQSGQSPGAPQ